MAGAYKIHQIQPDTKEVGLDLVTHQGKRGFGLDWYSFFGKIREVLVF